VFAANTSGPEFAAPFERSEHSNPVTVMVSGALLSLRMSANFDMMGQFVNL